MKQKHLMCSCYRTPAEKVEAFLRLALLIVLVADAVLAVWILILGLKS